MIARPSRRRLFGMGAAAVAADARNADAHPGTPAGAARHERSALIAGLGFTGPAAKVPGSGTDMHWWTWGADGDLYVVDDDGRNFGHPWNFAHLLRVRGTPPRHEVEEISRFPGLRRFGPDRVRYVSGIVAVDERLYVAAYDYDYSFPGDERWRVTENGEAVPIQRDEVTMMLDAVSTQAGVAALLVSDDGGRTWSNLPTERTPYFLGPRFGGLAFVGFGPGYTRVPAELGPYVYAVSNDESWETGHNVHLARAPRDRLLDRASWRFYAGVGARPAWTEDERRARPVLSDPGRVGHPAMTWNEALGRFLLAYSSDVVPHSPATPPAVAARTWHRARQLTILEGPTPWGPWGLVHHEPRWEGEHVAYLPQIPSKWLDADGLGGTLLFSGDYRQFGKPPRDGKSYYGFMTRPFRLARRR